MQDDLLRMIGHTIWTEAYKGAEDTLLLHIRQNPLDAQS